MNLASLVEELRPLPVTAPVGQVWNTADNIGSRQMTGIAYGNGVWVRVSGTSGTPVAERSVDGGATWVTETLPSVGSAIYGVCWGNGLFVAVGSAGYIATSPDGKTWASRSNPASGGATYYGCCYGNGLYLAFGGPTGTAGLLCSSPDGVTWTSRDPKFGSSYNPVNAGVWSGTQFVIVGGAGAAVVSTSPDGVTWTAQTISFAQPLGGVAYGNSIYVAVANASQNIATSPDGVTWTTRTPGITGSSAVLYSNGIFFATGGPTSRIAVDGINWTPVSTKAPSGLRACAAAPGQIIAVGYGSVSGGAMSTSVPAQVLPTPVVKIATTASWYRTTTFVAYTVDGSIGDVVIVGPTQAVASGGAPSAAPTSLTFISATPFSITFSWSNNGDGTSECRIWVDGVLWDPNVAPGNTTYTVQFAKNVPVGAHLIAVDHFLNGQASSQAGPTSMSTASAGSGPGSFTASAVSQTVDGRGRTWDQWTFTWTDVGPYEIWAAAVPRGAAAPAAPQSLWNLGSGYVAGAIVFSQLVGAAAPQDYYFWIRGTAPVTGFTALASNPLQAT
jgi:hypothetical protein